MTASMKIGLVCIGVVGVGLGAYLVNRGLKDDRKVNNTSGGAVAANDSTAGSATSGTTGASTPSPTLVPAEATGDRAASPPAWNLNELAGDHERSWRPHTPDATVPPTGTGATTPDPDPATPPETTTPDSPGSETAVPSDNTHEAATHTVPPTTPPVIEPSVPPVPTPTLTDNDRIGLREVTPSGRITGPSGTVGARPQAPTADTPEKTTIHVVQKGDTLSGLALKYLGSVRHAALIAKANPNVKPTRLMIGAKLKIPTMAAPTTAPATAGPTSARNTPLVRAGQPAPATPAPVDPARAYTVKPNDSWTGLARQFLGTDNWTELYELNKDRFPKNSRMLRPGMVLEVPPKPPTSTATLR